MVSKRRTKEPLHQRILGKSQVEIDLVQDLTDELENAYTLDLIEHDDYLKCMQALESRRERAEKALNKALQSPSVVLYARVAPKGENAIASALDRYGMRLLMVLAVIMFFKSF